MGTLSLGEPRQDPGTVHEVANGMLARQDGVRRPIAIIPNGSGNCISSGLGMRDYEIALDAIVGASCSKIDGWKVLFDCDDDNNFP